jgi:DNA-binding transcriptional ArsR family regulator
MKTAFLIKALANDRRLAVLAWLKDPEAHFPPQQYGDLVRDGVCGLFIADKLGVSQPTASEHLRLLTQAGFLKTKRIKQWTFYKRDEKRIAELRRLFRAAWMLVLVISQVTN